MSPAAISPLTDIKALTFDVFGTTVDWRTSVTEELVLRAHRKVSSSAQPGDGSSNASTLSAETLQRLRSMTEQDWARFAQEWRNEYTAFKNSFDPANSVWKTIDEHHHDSLVDLLRRWNLDGLYTEAELTSLSLVWHRLAPWPDAADGLSALGSPRGLGLVTATLSNGNLRLLRDLNDFGNLGFMRCFSAESFHAYKPNPVVYQSAVRELGLESHQVAMVACHLSDLDAAKATGMRTIYIERPQEEDWPEDDERYQRMRREVDLWIDGNHNGFLTLVEKLREIRA